MSRMLGTRGEAVAARHLRRDGLRILLRGHRVRHGELDLIARDGDTLVFVEVKTRRRGDPAEAVTPLKQRRVCRAALRFVRYHGLDQIGVRCRFDVVTVVWPDDRGRPLVEHHRDAFHLPADLAT
jgi:putative endonuclease